MAWYAIGRTAQSRRALAKLPVAVSRFADIYGVSPEEMRAGLLAVADGIDAVVAEGLTRADCWYLAGLDQFHGLFPAPVVPAPRPAANDAYPYPCCKHCQPGHIPGHARPCFMCAQS
jgi:hypothetical protein